MKPRERVLAALEGAIPDHVPRFEIWIDTQLPGLPAQNPARAYADLGQDCVMMPTINPQHSHAWRDGVDEWGRVWRDGMFVEGVVDTPADLERYSPPLDYVEQLFDHRQAEEARESCPDHCLIFGTHIGPITTGYMAMGFWRFFLRLVEEPEFVHRLLEARTEWCIAMYQKAVDLGAEVLVLGDDAGHSQGPMLSPAMWREFIFPYHQRIVDALSPPMIWHSDGNVAPLLPMAIEAGFVGFHGVDPMAGLDLATVKRAFGRELVIIGNVDVALDFRLGGVCRHGAARIPR